MRAPKQEGGARRPLPCWLNRDAYSENVCRSTVLPPCTTVIVALVKATSVISASQLLFGQPPCLPVGSAGAPVVTLKATFPFLISEAGMLCVPVSVTEPGFWPGA